MGLINKEGSVDDIRCRLKLIEGKRVYITDIQDAIDEEKKGANRSTVIKMLEAKLRKLNK